MARAVSDTPVLGSGAVVTGNSSNWAATVRPPVRPPDDGAQELRRIVTLLTAVVDRLDKLLDAQILVLPEEVAAALAAFRRGS